MSEAVSLRATVTPLRSSRPLPLSAGTSLAGSRLRATKTSATATVARGGAYAFRGRLAATHLVKGRTYLVRLRATDAAGHVRQLTLRARA